ncbi:MAG TPA: hypothetical protein VKB95_07940 [Chitinophagaceae bacterium]|nr:hypothetical protein [Chitinophagaceae bacterium]
MIKGDEIIVREIFHRKENIYSIRDIKDFSSGQVYLMSHYSKGIKLTFKNGDIYQFIWYDYLNFEKMKTAFSELKKISERSFI